MSIKRRSFMSGLLALPAAVLPWRALGKTEKWTESTAPQVVRITATEIEQMHKEWDRKFLKAFWEQAKAEGIPKPYGEYYPGPKIT